MVLFNFISGAVLYLLIGFVVAMLGYRYRGWKSTFDEEMLVVMSFLVWPLLLVFWIFAKLFKTVTKFGRMAADVAETARQRAADKQDEDCSCGKRRVDCGN